MNSVKNKFAQIIEKYEDSFTQFDLGMRIFAEALIQLEQVSQMVQKDDLKTKMNLVKAKELFEEAQIIFEKNNSIFMIPVIEKYLNLCRDIHSIF